MIEEFKNRLKNLNPERLENLKKFNILLNMAIEELSTPTTLSTFLKNFGFLSVEGARLSSLFKVMIISMIRSDLQLGAALIIDPNINRAAKKILSIAKIKSIFSNPKATMHTASNLELLADLSSTEGIPLEIMMLIIVDATAKLAIALSIKRPQFTHQELVSHTIKSLRTLKHEFFAVMVLAALVKIIEGSFNI